MTGWLSLLRRLLPLHCAWLIAVAAPVLHRPAPGVVAREMVRQAESAPWGQAYRARAGCAPYIPSGNTPFNAVDQWSFACTQVLAGIHRTEYYYASPEGPVTLQYLHLSLPLASLNPDHDSLFLALEQRLQRAYGRPLRPSGIAGTGAWRRQPERAGQLWTNKSSGIILHRERHVPRSGVMIEGPQMAVIEGQRFALAQEDDELAREIGLQLYFRGAHLGGDLLPREFPEYMDLMNEPPPPISDRAKREAAARQAAVHLLRQAESAAPERKALLLVAADVLVERVADLLVDERGEVAPAANTVRRQLRPFGVALGDRMWDGGLSYNMDLLRRAAAEAPATQWGEIAFVRMLARGLQWRAYFVCQPVDRFALVIREGEAYLAAHPETRHRKELMFTLALAWETWWSASHAPASDELTYQQFRPVRRRYLPRADEARRKAVQYYEGVIQTDPDSLEARSARRHLPRLRLGLDTGQRAFLCISC